MDLTATPICIRRVAGARASFRATLFQERRVIAVIDLGGPGPTITNDVEAVLADVHACLCTSGRRVIYRDSLGTWDEIVHDGAGGFRGFRAIGARLLGDALAHVAEQEGQ